MGTDNPGSKLERLDGTAPCPPLSCGGSWLGVRGVVPLFPGRRTRSLYVCWQKRGGKKGEYTGDVSRLAGQPVRLRFVIKEADLFALRFREQAPKEKPYTGFAIPGSVVVPK